MRPNGGDGSKSQGKRGFADGYRNTSLNVMSQKSKKSPAASDRGGADPIRRA
jgi:hypothetical protein